MINLDPSFFMSQKHKSRKAQKIRLSFIRAVRSTREAVKKGEWPSLACKSRIVALGEKDTKTETTLHGEGGDNWHHELPHCQKARPGACITLFSVHSWFSAQTKRESSSLPVSEASIY
jgi:hypothetical protein